MEYAFCVNEQLKPEANFSAGFTAFGLWMSTELAEPIHAAKIAKNILSFIEELKKRPFKSKVFDGSDFFLALSGDTAKVVSHIVEANEVDEFQCAQSSAAEYDEANNTFDNADFYDEELMAECGIDDFKSALLAWLSFIEKPA